MGAHERTRELLEGAVGRSRAEAPTPVAVVDLDRTEANLERLREYTGRHGIALWPHTKTHKSTMLGQLQLDLGAVGLTVAKPGEAKVFADAGLGPLLLHYPPVGADVVERLVRVATRAPLTVALDSLRAAEDLSAGLAVADVQAEVLIELDTGLGRTGLAQPADAAALGLAVDRLPALSVTGLSTYPGHIRGPTQQLAAGVDDVDDKLRAARDAFLDTGLGCERISGGSTPTRYLTHETCVNELRAGTAIFLDRQSAHTEPDLGLGACALTIEVTVVSNAVPGRVAIDAGSKTLTSDPHPDGGFGAIVGHSELSIVALNEEHGYVDLGGRAEGFDVGDRLSVIPNHVCACVNLHDYLLAVRGGTVERVIEVEARGLVR